MRVGMGMREPEDLSSAATDPPYRAPRHEPPEQQRPGAQPDEVQDEEIHVAGDKRRRHDQGDHRSAPRPAVASTKAASRGALAATSRTGS